MLGDASTKPPQNDVISSVADVVDVVRRLRDEAFVKRQDGWPFHKFPFGIWFRGQSRVNWPLLPRVHRDERMTGGKPQTGAWDETNIFEHLKVRAPEYQHTYQTAFDWLCLMQHYSVPTRLLDWSEYALPALYFAVKDDLSEDGELIVLNARCLNDDPQLPSIFPPGEGQVVLRAEMAWTRRASKWLKKTTVAAALTEEQLAETSMEELLERLRTPIAVFPSRLNDRMVFQSSVFTLHGGKIYPEGMRQHYEPDAMPAPTTLEQIDLLRPQEQRILKRYTIPHTVKADILEGLSLIGIHEATLFPEVDRQAIYLQELWWHTQGGA